MFEFYQDPYKYTLDVFGRDNPICLTFSWAKRNSLWNYGAPNDGRYKNTFRKDMLFGFSRTYVRNLRMYTREFYCGPLKVTFYNIGTAKEGVTDA